MTAIAKTGVAGPTQHVLPDTLNTLERLGLWFLLLFYRLNNAKDILLTDGSANKQVAYQRFKGQDGNLYLGFTVFMPVDQDFEVLPLKPWEYAVELNNAVASTNYNS
ncbi:hypothetical protein [Pseudanabaena sp. 'Roaring Creek']|uniref:hypothetical protein n=1 Tax=Pseudanabaena sp. 'Roaring Creek' TaxID=1681830 RepID=UPI0006D81C1C|nr:hypothetical protein [Pseudanabaena sp. 'Roaring Creek']